MYMYIKKQTLVGSFKISKSLQVGYFCQNDYHWCGWDFFIFFARGEFIIFQKWSVKGKVAAMSRIFYVSLILVCTEAYIRTTEKKYIFFIIEIRRSKNLIYFLPFTPASSYLNEELEVISFFFFF